MIDKLLIVDVLCSICMFCFMMKLVGIVEQSTQLVCIRLVQNGCSCCQCLHTFTVESTQQFNALSLMSDHLSHRTSRKRMPV